MIDRPIRTATCGALGVLTLVLLTGCPSNNGGGPNGGGQTMTLTDDDIETNNRGVALMGQYAYKEAAEVFATLVDRHPTWVDARVNLAIATLNQDDEGTEVAAIAMLEEALVQEPDHLRAHYCLGILKDRANLPEESAQHFQTVLDGDPDDAYAHYRVGAALEATGDYPAARARFEKTLELNPYLRSAYYRLSQLARRTSAPELAEEMSIAFNRLDGNPRAMTVDTVYTKMGPKAEALAIGLDTEPMPLPAGDLFGTPFMLDTGQAECGGGLKAGDRPFSVTSADIDGNGRSDLFITGNADGVPNFVFMQSTAGDFTFTPDHPLGEVTDVNTALWGDINNDGRVDVYLCREGANALWTQTDDGWVEVTWSTGTDGGGLNTVDGAMVDADHDGDLDIYCANSDGPNELLNNNGNGTFTRLAEEYGLQGEDHASKQVLFADIDGDRDLDIVLLSESGQRETFLNDRLWAYTPVRATGDAAGASSRPSVMTVADVDADGRLELFELLHDGSLWRGSYIDGVWTGQTMDYGSPIGEPVAIDANDYDGDGTPEIRIAGSGTPIGRWQVIEHDTGIGHMAGGAPIIAATTTTVLDPNEGPVVVDIHTDGVIQVAPAGPGRHAFAAVQLTGLHDAGNAMRSNASGFGASGYARLGSDWASALWLDVDSSPGQSHLPAMIGLGGRSQMDFITIDWSDGVRQTELAIGGGLQVITEDQRQRSSCPLIFVWNGERYEFVSDILGVGGLGYLLAPGEYAEPRPRERFRLPDGLVQPKDGRVIVKLGEPMEETLYLDACDLVVYDLPPGWDMVFDERMGVSAPMPTGEPRFYRDMSMPVAAWDGAGHDILDTIATADLTAVNVPELDRRHLGRLSDEHIVTVEFDGSLQHPRGSPVLVIDGWVEYPYSQTMFRAWQAGATYDAPTIEARDEQGVWHTVAEQIGYPAGMPREMSIPLTLPVGCDALRLRTTLEVYWDRIAVAWVESCPDARVTTISPSVSELRRVGFPRRTTGPNRLPMYDYDDRAPIDVMRHQSGLYTRFGPVDELTARIDDALVVLGPGEEVHLEYDLTAAGAAPVSSGRRVLTLDATGWCKDMDLYTRDGDTVDPLPTHRPTSLTDPAQRPVDLHRRFNTRQKTTE